MLRVDHFSIGAIPSLTFTVPDGECLAVVGPSGSGKSRLLRAIADLDPAGGHLFVDGVERREMSGPQWRRLVRYVAAEPHWWTDTARQAFPEETLARALRMLSGLGLQPSLLDQPVMQLSTGERQRLALARAFADEPRVLLLDEPTSALDQTSAALVEELIRFQVLAGRTVLLASHDMGLVRRLAQSELQLGPQQQPPPLQVPPAEAALAVWHETHTGRRQ